MKLHASVMVEMSRIELDESILIRPVDDEHVKELADSIEKIGQIVPVIIEEIPGKKAMFKVIAHAHEFQALKTVNAGTNSKAGRFEILCRRFEGTETERKLLQLTENVSHKSMKMEDVGCEIEKIMNANLKLKQTEIARVLGCSQAYVSQCLGSYKNAQNPQNDDIASENINIYKNQKSSTPENSTEGEKESSDNGPNDDEDEEPFEDNPTEDPPTEHGLKTANNPGKTGRTGEEKMLNALNGIRTALKTIHTGIGEIKADFHNNDIFIGDERKNDAVKSWTAKLQSVKRAFVDLELKIKKRLENEKK